MAESSIFWTTGGAGDGATTYTQTQLFAWLKRMLVGRSPTTEGVLAGYNNELAVSGSASPVSINTGAAIVYGVPYENDTSTTIAIPTPSAGNSRYDRIVLRASWSGQTVRITRIAGVESTGTPNVPALTQTAGTTWDIPLATLLITAAGAITLTDNRSFTHFNTRVSTAMLDDLNVTTAKLADASVTTAKIADGAVTTVKHADGSVTTVKLATDSVDDTIVGSRVPALAKRQGGSSTDWSTSGTTNYTVGNVRILTGVVDVTIPANQFSGSVTITFPTAFSQPPVVFLQQSLVSPQSYVTDLMAATPSSVGASSLSISLERQGSTFYSSAFTRRVMWVAIGPE